MPTAPTPCPSWRTFCSLMSWPTGCALRARALLPTASTPVRACGAGHRRVQGLCSGAQADARKLQWSSRPDLRAASAPVLQRSPQRGQRARRTLGCPARPAGTVNTKMLFAGWGPIGMRVQVGSGLRSLRSLAPSGTRCTFRRATIVAARPAAWSAGADIESVHKRVSLGIPAVVLQDANDEFNAATDPGLNSVSGAYFVGSRQTRSPAVSYDKDVQRRLWGVLEAQTGAHWDI